MWTKVAPILRVSGLAWNPYLSPRNVVGGLNGVATNLAKASCQVLASVVRHCDVSSDFDIRRIYSSWLDSSRCRVSSVCCSSELVDDVVDATDGDGILVTVRRSKTNQEGEVNNVRFVKDGVARALRTLRAATSPEPGDRVVPLSAQMIGLRFTAAAMVAGVESRVTAHSGRVGLASELTSRGASIFPETSLPLDLPGNEEAGSRWGPDHRGRRESAGGRVRGRVPPSPARPKCGSGSSSP